MRIAPVHRNEELVAPLLLADLSKINYIFFSARLVKFCLLSVLYTLRKTIE